MLTVPLAAVSAVAAIDSAISTEDGAKRAEKGDDFAALLGLQVAVAAGETKPGPAITRPALPKGGKALPEVAEADPETAEVASADQSAPEEPAPLPQARLELSALPQTALAFFAPVQIIPATAPASPLPHGPAGAKPVEANAKRVAAPESPRLPEGLAPLPQTAKPAPTVAAEPEAKSEIAPGKKDDTAEKPAPARPNAAPQFSLPAQASDRAVLVRSVDATQPGGPNKPAPILPEQAAAQATIALAARGNPERPGRVAHPVAAIALPTDAETPSALPPVQLHQLKDGLAERLPSVDLSAPLVTANLESDPQSAPQATTIAPASVPGPARHDFTAMIDRLIEARDMAGAQPIAMALRHEDFGTVSLNFRTADDGLTVTMASPDPEFVHAVGAAAASGAMSQGDLTRHSGETAPSRQHLGGSMSEDSTGQSRAGSREAERDGSRQRRDQPPPQRSEPRQQGRSDIFA